MPTGYTRQSAADIVTGNTINAAPLNNEFNQVQAAMDATTGHNHDGTAGGGAPISLATAVTGTLAVAQGGTGASTAANARTNLGLGTLATQAASAVAITGGTAQFDDGAAATPSISNAGDTNTGMFFPAADTVAVSCDGVERVRVTSAGRVGIADAAPTFKLSVIADPLISGDDGILTKDALNRSMSISRTGGSYSYQGISGAVGLTYSSTTLALMSDNTNPILFSAGGAERMRVSSNGRIGIGNSSPERAVHISSTAAAADDNGVQYTVSGDPTKNLIVGITGVSHNYSGVTGEYGRVYSSIGLALVADIIGGNNPILFSTGQQERMRISGTGTVHFPSVGTTASAANAFLDSSGTPANQLLRSTSSIRYKTGVTDITLAEAQNVFSLRPIKYQSLADADDKDRVWYGLIAEEVAEVDQRLVHFMDGQPDGVQYERIIVPLLKIVKDLSQRVAALEAQNG